MCFSLSTVHDCFAFVPWNWFQVHIEFRRQCLEMTVDKLLEQFVLNKYTGLEKPGKFIFVIYVSFFISPWPARTRPQFPFLYHLDLLKPDHNFLFYITLTCSNQTTISFFILPWPAQTRPQFPFLYHLDLLEPDHNFLFYIILTCSNQTTVSFCISPWPARTRPKFPFDIWCVYVESSATLMPVKCYWCIWCLIEYTSLKGWSFLAFIMNSLT